MGNIFKHEINITLIKTILERSSIPEKETSYNFFLQLHKPVKNKIWFPKFVVPSVPIGRIYLNGIIIGVFTILFVFLVFFQGFSMKSEKKEKQKLIKEVHFGTPTTPSLPSEPSVKQNSSNEPIVKEIFSDTTPSQSLISKNTADVTKANSIEKPAEKTDTEEKVPDTLRKTDISSVKFSDTLKSGDDQNGNLRKPKRKRSRKRKSELPDILPSQPAEIISIPSGNQTEEDIRLRDE